MQPHDQDELRRRAQEVLARRIAVDSDDAPAAPPPQRAKPNRRQQQQNRRRASRQDLPRPEQLEERLERMPEPVYVESVEPEPLPTDDLMVRTERRIYAEDTSDIHSQRETSRAYSWSGVAPKRSEIHRAIHDPAAVRQAIVLAEILGKPVALREQDESETFGVV